MLVYARFATRLASLTDAAKGKYSFLPALNAADLGSTSSGQRTYLDPNLKPAVVNFRVLETDGPGRAKSLPGCKFLLIRLCEDLLTCVRRGEMHGGLPGWTRRRRGWRGQGRGARRGALAEQAGVRSGGSEPVE